MQSTAKTVEEYLASLPEDRKAILSKIRQEILKVLPEGYEEAINWGMICYQVPLSIFPDTYNKQPMMFVALASQKNHMAIYMMNIYARPEQADWLKAQFKVKGKKLNMGKSCIRFKKLENIVLEPILELIQNRKMEDYINYVKSARTTKK